MNERVEGDTGKRDDMKEYVVLCVEDDGTDETVCAYDELIQKGYCKRKKKTSSAEPTLRRETSFVCGIRVITHTVRRALFRVLSSPSFRLVGEWVGVEILTLMLIPRTWLGGRGLIVTK